MSDSPVLRSGGLTIELHCKRSEQRTSLTCDICSYKNSITKDGPAHPADIVILAIGVRPETSLAKAASLTLGEGGGIRVDEQMRTSDPHIFAVGDAVEVHDRVTGAWTLLALAGPANRQGRVAADAICGLPAAFHGTQGTAICGIFDMAVASTGASEKVLQRAGMTDCDLEEAEHCYAPQFGSAKDVINFAGMISANHLRGIDPILHWKSPQLADCDMLDVRDPDEFSDGHAPDAKNIPLNEL